MWRGDSEHVVQLLMALTAIAPLATLAALATGVGLAVSRRRLGRLAGGLALGVASALAVLALALITYDSSASRVGEGIVPLWWGGVLGSFAFSATMLAMVLPAGQAGKRS